MTQSRTPDMVFSHGKVRRCGKCRLGRMELRRVKIFSERSIDGTVIPFDAISIKEALICTLCGYEIKLPYTVIRKREWTHGDRSAP